MKSETVPKEAISNENDDFSSLDSSSSILDDSDPVDNLGMVANDDSPISANASAPIVIPLGHICIPELQTEDEVIEGVVVTQTTERKKSRRLECILLFITLSFAIIVIAIVTTSSNSPVDESQNAEPTISPSNPIPQDAFMSEYLRELFIPISGDDVLDDPSTVQHNLWKLMVTNIPILVQNGVLLLNETNRITQRYILAVVTLSAMRDDDARKEHSTNNLGFPHECQFYTCNENDEVTKYEMRNQWSSHVGGGVLAAEIAELHSLSDLVLRRNALRGTIPSKIGNLQNLRVLDLGGNLLSGTIPTGIGRLQNLKKLSLNNNFLQKEIPSELGSLQSTNCIDLSQNSLTGTIPIEINDLSNVNMLALHQNKFSGGVLFLCNELTNSTCVEQGQDKSLELCPNCTQSGVILDCNNSVLECDCCKCI